MIGAVTAVGGWRGPVFQADKIMEEPVKKKKVEAFSPVREDELKDVLETLESDCIDDSEDILQWFGENGPSMIREILKSRKAKA